MDLKITSPAATIRTAWSKLSKLPGGKQAFSTLIGRIAPYSGSIGAVVQELGPGVARVQLKDRRCVRNHLRSVHAMALTNLAEFASGLAMMYGIPNDARGILRGFSIEYLKKARGTLVAVCSFDPPTTSAKNDYEVEVEIFNESEEVVAKAKALWRIGPV